MKNLISVVTLLIITSISSFCFGQKIDKMSLKEQIEINLGTLNQNLKPHEKPMENSETKRLPPPGSVWRYPFGDYNYETVKIIPNEETLPDYKTGYLKGYKKVMKKSPINIMFTYKEAFFGIPSIDETEPLRNAKRTFFEEEEIGFCFYFTSRQGRLKEGKDFNDKITFNLEILDRSSRKIAEKTMDYREIVYGAKNFEVKYYKFSLGSLPPGSYAVLLKIISSSREEFEENSFGEHFDVLVRNKYQSKLK